MSWLSKGGPLKILGNVGTLIPTPLASALEHCPSKLSQGSSLLVMKTTLKYRRTLVTNAILSVT